MNRFLVGQLWQAVLDGEVHYLKVIAVKDEGRVADFLLAKRNERYFDINRASLSKDWVMIEDAKPDFGAEYDPFAPPGPQGGPTSKHRSDYDPSDPDRV